MHRSKKTKKRLIIFVGFIFNCIWWHLQCQIPIIYHDDYNIKLDNLLGDFSFFTDVSIPFDTERYNKIFNFLKANGVAVECFIRPSPVTQSGLLLVHSNEYITNLQKPKYLADILELPILAKINHLNIEKYFLNSVCMAAGGTVLGCQLAIDHGWAINLSGGYHHAKKSSGGGFCVISDIAIAIKKYWETYPSSRILIVDLDAHQGTGYAEIFLNNGGVFIFDVYNSQRLPVKADIQQDTDLRARINFNHPVMSGIKDEEYLKILTDYLPEAISSCNPDLIIYIAGTDVFDGDLAGGMKISLNAIIQRDEYVFYLAEKFNKPILMLLAGGYSNQSAEISGRSILNILRTKGVWEPCCLQMLGSCCLM